MKGGLTMEVNELMIGDWVMYNPNVFIEDEYEPTKECYPTKISNGTDIDLAIENRYTPIPLTAEILEKNGILLHNSASYFKEYMWTIGGIDEYADVYIEVGKDQQDNWRWDKLKFKLHFCGGDVLLMKMHYVHELQHILRLCKIDKSIELLKQ